MPGGARPSAVAAACSCGLGLVMLDNTSVAVALPAMQDDLHTEVAGLQWVIAILALGTTAALPMSGVVGDRLGPRRVAQTGLVLFAVAASASALAPSLPALVAARAVAGIGVALMLPNTAALLGANVAPHERGRAVGAWISFGSLGLIAGPLLGGLLVPGGGWRTVFLLPIPVAIAGMLALRRLTEPPAQARTPVNVLGLLAGSTGVLAVAFGLIELGREQRRILLAVAVLLAGLVLLATFALIERRTVSPLLDPALLRDRRYPAVLLASLTYNGSIGGAFFLLALLLQSGRGLDARFAGMVLVVATIGMPVGGQLSSRAQARMGRRALLVGAVALVALSYGSAAALATGPLVALAAVLSLGGLAVGLLFSADTLAVLDLVSPAKSSSGLAGLSLARQTGTVLGVAGLGAVAEIARVATGEPLTGLRAGLLAAALVLLLPAALLVRALPATSRPVPAGAVR